MVPQQSTQRFLRIEISSQICVLYKLIFDLQSCCWNVLYIVVPHKLELGHCAGLEYRGNQSFHDPFIPFGVGLFRIFLTRNTLSYFSRHSRSTVIAVGKNTRLAPLWHPLSQCYLKNKKNRNTMWGHPKHFAGTPRKPLWVVIVGLKKKNRKLFKGAKIFILWGAPWTRPEGRGKLIYSWHKKNSDWFSSLYSEESTHSTFLRGCSGFPNCALT